MDRPGRPLVHVKAAAPHTVGEALAAAAERLEKAGLPHAPREAREMVARATGASTVPLDLRAAEPWTRPAQAILESLVRRRLARIPLAHLLGEWDFLDMTLTVTPDVLIPRPETEELFEWITECVPAEGAAAPDGPVPREVVDVGTGAGGLALALARYWPEARVTAVDASSSALAVARWNARRHGLESRVVFRNGDLLAGLGAASVDLVVANLPYVTTAEWADLEPEVRREPRAALDGGPDGLAVIRRLIPQAAATLRPGGRLFLEVGSGQASAVAEQLRAAGFSNVALRKDFAGIDRCVGAQKLR